MEEEQIPQERIISVSWTEDQIIYFLINLSKNNIFGYSAAFKYEDIIRRAELYDISLRPLPSDHPLRIKYDKYVLKVTKAYKTNNKRSKLKYHEVRFNCDYIRKKASTSKVCNMHPELYRLIYGIDKTYTFRACTNVIPHNTEYLEIVSKNDVKSKGNYKRISLCPKCAAKLIKIKIAELKDLIII